MPKYVKHLYINAILLIVITTFISRIFSLDNHRNRQNQIYDYVDLAKETAGSRSKGQTTRIFTTDAELDEKFWLKYLGEDFRHATHLQVDSKNNVIPLANVKPPTAPTLNYKSKAEKRTRFARQSMQNDAADKQLPVENSYDENENEQYPTEKPGTFNGSPHTTTTTTLPHTEKPCNSCNTLPQLNTRKPLIKQKEKLHLYNKHKVIKVKPTRNYNQAMNEPIVVHLPESDNSEHQIDEEYAPLIVQIPPVIYHQKAEHFMPKNQLYTDNQQMSNLPSSLNKKNMEFYSPALQQNREHFYPEHSTMYGTHSTHQTYYTNLHNSQSQQYILPHTQYATHSHIQQTYPYQTHDSSLPPRPPPAPN